MAIQDHLIKATYPNFEGGCQRNRGSWTGCIQPTELSPSYKVKVEYVSGERPNVYVLDPALRHREPNEPIPHMYDQKRLCLFYPSSGDWSPADPIAHTVIPWASLWLYFYEIWFLTGEWLGKGIHSE